MPHNLIYETKKLLARALYEKSTGDSARAFELLSQIITLGRTNSELTREYTYRQAHAELFSVCLALGQDQEAFQYYKKAIQLGMHPDEIERSANL